LEGVPEVSDDLFEDLFEISRSETEQEGESESDSGGSDSDPSDNESKWSPSPIKAQTSKKLSKIPDSIILKHKSNRELANSKSKPAPKSRFVPPLKAGAARTPRTVNKQIVTF
jgi:hypothetical protein